jgi:hypothetical protein
MQQASAADSLGGGIAASRSDYASSYRGDNE